MDKNNKGKLILNIILFLVSVGILVYFCVSGNNLETLINFLPNLNYMWLILAVCAIFLSWLFDSKVIRLIIMSASQKKFSRKSAFRITMVGQYFSAITPLGMAGQPMQILALTQKGVSAGVSVSVFVRKFLIYQSTMTIYSLLVIIYKFSFFSSHIPLFIPLVAIGIISQSFTLLLLILFYINKNFTTKIIHAVFYVLSKFKIIKNPEKSIKSVEDQLNSFVENNSKMRINKQSSMKLYLYSFLQLTFLFSIPFIIYKAFNGAGFPFISLLCTQVFLNTISSYTPLPGAAGTTETIFLLLFSEFFASELIVPAMLMCRIITYYLSVIVGFIFVGFKFCGKNNKC